MSSSEPPSTPSSSISPSHPPPSLPLSSFHLNQRVQVDHLRGPKATIRYIGPLHTHPASITYIGLQWDDDNRGKHDGHHDGRSYFSAPAGSASFVRHERLLPGRAFVEAVRERYGEEEQKEEQKLYLSAVNVEGRGDARRSRAFDVEVQFVGASTVSRQIAQQLSKMSSVSLVDGHVDRAGDAITTAVPSASDVDLSHNLLMDWAEVAQIVRALPHLSVLKLSHNAMQPLPSPPPPFTSAFCCLHTLVLNAVPWAWETVLTLASHQHLPRLTELHLAHNRISSLSPPSASASIAQESKQDTQLAAVDLFSSSASACLREWQHYCFLALTTLDLSHNQLSDWDEVCRLASLPRLQHLHLNHNRLRQITYPASSSSSLPFASLSTLSLSDNDLQSLSILSSLSRFPSLSSLSVQRNPALDSAASHSSSTLRFHAISRIPSLLLLNSSSIPTRERADAEKFYLTFALEQWRQREEHDRAKTVQDMFPRYAALAARYEVSAGEGEEQTGGDGGAIGRLSGGGGTTLGSQTVEVVLQLYGEGGEVVDSATRRLLLTMKVSALRVMLDRVFQISPALRSSYVMKAKEDQTSDWEMVDDALKQLSYYGVRERSCVALMQRK